MSEERNLKVLSQDAIANLNMRAIEFHNSGQSLEQYLELVNGPDFLGNEDHLLTTRISSSSPPDMNLLAKPEFDADAAILVFNWLGEIDRLHAQDGRLWTTLAFNEFGEYMHTRWGQAKEDKWIDRISGKRTARWVLQSASRETLARNGISRLWWAAKLCKDPALAGPLSRQGNDEWAYLKVLFEKADRFLAFAERQISSVQPILFAMLELIASDSKYATESYVRGLVKRVDLAAGYTELGALNTTQAKAFVERQVLPDE